MLKRWGNMNKDKIIELLQGYNREEVERFASYVIRLLLEKDKQGKAKNIWIQNRTDAQMAELYRRVAQDGLVFDGTHITLQSTGISYDYIAYKNKMLLAYPESKIDVNLTYKDDEFKVAKESGSIVYSHNIANPFDQKDEDVIGGYCVISNSRGEFLTLLSKADIEKHRKVAKTDYIWSSWFKEMALKTIIKKACKQHFADVYQNIENNDNDNYELENPLGLDIKYKKEIDALKTIEELQKYYLDHKGLGKDFDKYVTIKKNELNEQNTQHPTTK